MKRIKVSLVLDRHGDLHGRPVSGTWAKRFEDIVRDNGGADAGGRVDGFFLQGDAAYEFLAELPRQRAKDLRDGWHVVVLLDPWYVGHLYGYDAHTAAE